jgi:hypothetical protein
MKIREGYYILNRPENPVTEAEANAMIKYLMEDIKSEAPLTHWDFHQSQCNMHSFIGGSSKNGKYRYVFEKTPTKDGYQIIFNYYGDATKSQYTMVDLRMGPQSMLEDLYDLVFSVVHATAHATGKYPSKHMYSYQ